MSLDQPQNHIKALAGIFQACALVKELAWHGRSDTMAMRSILASLFTLDSDNVDQVYGSTTKIVYGLKILQHQLDNNKSNDHEIIRYAISLLHLQKQLSKQPVMLERLASGIEKARQQLQYFDVLHINICANFADLYQNTISQLGPRIMVNGEHIHLANSENTNKIRALLLAGIRSAVLFRQCKGSKIKLLLRRKKYLQITGELLGSNV